MDSMFGKMLKESPVLPSVPGVTQQQAEESHRNGIVSVSFYVLYHSFYVYIIFSLVVYNSHINVHNYRLTF